MPLLDRMTLVRTTLGIALILGFGLGIFSFYRVFWSHKKRLREVTAGRLYRSGQMTAQGFREAIEEHGIRCIVNLQNEDEDGRDLVESWKDKRTIPEEALCRELGVKYIQLAPDLVSRNAPAGQRPAVIEEMLKAYDDPENYPMMVHCKAGLHRTGILIAVYRMEFEGWTPDQAYREMRSHGFGDTVCNEANDYVREYVLEFRPGRRNPGKLIPPQSTTPVSLEKDSAAIHRKPSEAQPCSP